MYVIDGSGDHVECYQWWEWVAWETTSAAAAADGSV